MPASTLGPAGTVSNKAPLREATPPLGDFFVLFDSLLKLGGIHRVKEGWGLDQHPESPIQGCLVIPKDRRLGGEGGLLWLCHHPSRVISKTPNSCCFIHSFTHSLTHPFIDCLCIQPLPQTRLCAGPRDAEVKEECLLTSVKGTPS